MRNNMATDTFNIKVHEDGEHRVYELDGKRIVVKTGTSDEEVQRLFDEAEPFNHLRRQIKLHKKNAVGTILRSIKS
jgi:hypothetical protein